jgi:imidazolonepropionase-like amidohydrolase
MRAGLAALAAIAAALLMGAQAQTAPATPQAAEGAGITHLWAGRLLAEPGRGLATAQTVVIERGRIVRVVPGYVPVPQGGETLDLRGMTVLPGLIDAHVHLLFETGPDRRLDAVTMSEAAVVLQGAEYAERTLKAGFTTVQDVGGSDAIFALRDSIAKGETLGPRIRAAGSSITPTGGHGDSHGYRLDVLDLMQSRTVCDGPADCRRAVRDAVRRGADLIKITATGGVLSNTAAGVERQFFDDEFEAIVGAARMMGRQVTAHAHGVTGVNAALRAGVNSIEHGTYLDAESVRLFRQNRATLVPTVLAGAHVAAEAQNSQWMSPAVRAKALEIGPRMLGMLRRAREGGVNIVFGTDTGVSPHGQNAREFALWVEAGFTPEQAIRAATVLAAEHLQLSDQIGRIAPGLMADIIAVGADPLTNVRELESVDFVMKGGAVVVAP